MVSYRGLYWPTAIAYRLHSPSEGAARSIEARFAELGLTPDYFIITDFNLWDNYHTDLQVFLRQNATLLAQTDRYLIYRLPEMIQ
jgi:hypothetical protein